jgi:putative redox protein
MMENKIDKSKMLQSHIVLVNEAVNFKGTVEGNPPISIDYTPPLGNNLGYTSLELFLLSLSSCMGTALLAILRKMRKEISHFEIYAEGERKSEHPAGFQNITIMIHVKSEGLTDAEMVRAIQSMEGICPVLSMVNEKVDVQTMFQIVS